MEQPTSDIVVETAPTKDTNGHTDAMVVEQEEPESQSNKRVRTTEEEADEQEAEEETRQQTTIKSDETIPQPNDLLGPILNTVKVHEWQLFSPRLAAILQMEKEDKPLSPDVVLEKNKLFAQGFPLWERNDFRAFLQACIDRGGKDAPIVDLAAAIPHKHLDDVKRYAIAFWTRGAECFSAETWATMMELMERKKHGRSASVSTISEATKPLQNGKAGVKAALAQPKEIIPEQENTEELINHVRRKLQQGSRLEFHKSLHYLLGQEFCQEEDKFLLECFLARKSKEDIREAVLKSPVFVFDHFFRSLSATDLQKRLDTLVDVVEKDAEELAKVEAKAQRERERKEQEDALLLKREAELVAKIEEMERLIAQGGSAPAIPTSPEAAAGEGQGDPHSPHPDEVGDDASDAGQASLDPKYHDQVLKMVVHSGTCGMAQLVDKVIRVLPDGVISKRQLKRDITRLAVKEKRAGDRAARWYPREGTPTASSTPEQ